MQNSTSLHRKGNENHLLSKVYGSDFVLSGLIYTAVATIVKSRATTKIEIANERMTNDTRSVLGYTISDSSVVTVCEPLDIPLEL